MMRPLRWLGLLSVCLLLVLGMTSAATAQMRSDDDDYTAPASDDDDDGRMYGTSPSSSQNAVDSSMLHIGVLSVRPTFEAKQQVPKAVRDRIDQLIFSTTEEINFAERQIVPFDSIMKQLGPREQKQYMTCWLNPMCLSKTLEPAKIDITIASKLRMVQVQGEPAGDPSTSIFENQQVEKPILAEYSLFIRIIDTKRGRILREVLVTHTDIGRIPEMGQKAYREALMQLGFIVDRPIGAATVSDADDADTMAIEEAIKPEPVQNKGMKIAAWTTLGLGLTCEVLGLTFGVLSKQKQNDAESATTLTGLRSANDDRNTYMITANTMYAVGGGLLISSVVLFVLGYSSDDVVGSGGGDSGSPELTGGGLSLGPEGGVFFQAQGRF
jgi:hypothetical protein